MSNYLIADNSYTNYHVMQCNQPTAKFGILFYVVAKGHKKSQSAIIANFPATLTDYQSKL